MIFNITIISKLHYFYSRFEDTDLLHLLQVQARPPQLSAKTVTILPVRCRLLKVGQDDWSSRWRHHLQLKAHGGLEAPRGAGAEEDRAGRGGQAGAGLH